VDKAIHDSGFSSRSRLYDKVPKKIGMTPTEYREGGVEVSIKYAIFETSITKVLVARTQRGVCALYMGESDESLIESLMKEFPYADIVRDENYLADVIQTVADYFEGRDYNPRLPLDVHKTAFQWQVLEAIQEIPPGETKTYSELAESIGKPRSVRAVASACGKNPVSVLIPCHRVLRKNGEIGGYRWGIPIKQKLLRHEKTG
jgi:AraC family transcriptional regulator of adaptative response/methylated-DNA-[protein]-cysteine methyltransferase